MLYETLTAIGGLTLLFAAIWFLISLLRAAFLRWRRSGLRQAALALVLAVVAVVGGVIAHERQDLDYGLTSPEGLEDARRMRREKMAVASEKAAEEQAKAAQARQVAEDAEHSKRENEARAEAAIEVERAEAAAKITAEKERLELCNNTTMAFVMSQTFVERSLKSPKSAEFPSMSDELVHVTPLKDCAFRVVAYVDAQNAFGAWIRSRYIVDLKLMGGQKELWQVRNIIIN